MSRTIVYSRTARSFHNPFTGLGVSLVFGQTMSVSGGLEGLFETQMGVKVVLITLPCQFIP